MLSGARYRERLDAQNRNYPRNSSCNNLSEPQAIITMLRMTARVSTQRDVERLGANKQLIYRYIGSKRELYQTVLLKVLAERADTLRTRPATAQDQVVHWFESALAHPWWIRLRQWEALEVHEGAIVDDKKRREHFKAAVDSVEARQARGELSPELDPRLLLLLLSALAAYPLAFPHDTRLITGMPPTDELFVEAWTEFARRVVARLKLY